MTDQLTQPAPVAKSHKDRGVLEAFLKTLAVALVAALLVGTFIWAAVESRPRNIPLGVAAPEPAVQAITAALEEMRPGAFEVQAVDGEQAARDQIASGELYGALIIGQQGATILTASAASPPVATALAQIPQRVAAQAAQHSPPPAGDPSAQASQGASQPDLPGQGAGQEGEQAGQAPTQSGQPGEDQGQNTPPPAGANQTQAGQGQGAPDQASQQAAAMLAGLANAQVEDVVPLAAKDPNGSAFGMMVIPLVVVALLFGVLIALTVQGTWLKLGTALVGSLFGGAAVAAVAGPWLGILPQGAFGAAMVMALAMAAIALAIVGAHALIGIPGVPLVAVIVFLLGNPFSGSMAGPLVLPDGWAQLGQALPPGAVATALRSVVYFDGANSGLAITVLAIWAAVGAAALLIRAAVPAKAATAN